MVIKKCIVCGKEFEAKGRDKCCNLECSRERYKQYNKKYYQENKEKLRKCMKQYYQNNKQYNKQYNKEYYQENKEKLRKRMKQYYQENKEDCWIVKEDGKKYVVYHKVDLLPKYYFENKYIAEIICDFLNKEQISTNR